jgi:hypothetical protein
MCDSEDKRMIAQATVSEQRKQCCGTSEEAA